MEFHLSCLKKMTLLKCYTQYVGKFGKLISVHGIWKSQFSFQSQIKAIPKNVQTTAQLHSSHTLAKMLKILQARLQQYVNQELPDVQAGFRKGRWTKDQIANNCWIIEKEISRKKSTSASLTTLNTLNVWITTNWKIFRDGNTRPPYLSPEKSVCRSKSNS